MADKDMFASMTPEQLDYWIREIRPILVRMRERSQERARQRAFDLIRRPLRDRPTDPETIRHHIESEE